MPATPRAVLVDIDGTLLDSNYLHTVAWMRGFAAAGHVVPAWRIHRHMGMGGDKLVAAVAGDEVEETHGDAVRERWEQEFDAMLPETRLVDGATDLLDALAAAGLQVVLASSGRPRHADRALRLLDAAERGLAWTTSEDVEQTKPHPELLQVALGRVGASAGEALVIGDAVWDVEAASRLGIATVALLCGGFGRQELLDAGAVAAYDDPRDLQAHLGEALDSTRTRHPGDAGSSPS
ncbi:MAG TPA: HAD family hydrolase [Marmoricola sp.]